MGLLLDWEKWRWQGLVALAPRPRHATVLCETAPVSTQEHLMPICTTCSLSTTPPTPPPGHHNVCCHAQPTPNPRTSPCLSAPFSHPSLPQVINVCCHANPRLTIRRARFSALIPRELQRAVATWVSQGTGRGEVRWWEGRRGLQIGREGGGACRTGVRSAIWVAHGTVWVDTHWPRGCQPIGWRCREQWPAWVNRIGAGPQQRGVG